MYPFAYITTELYSEKNFPRHNFPNLDSVLKDLFKKECRKFANNSFNDAAFLEAHFSILALIRKYPHEFIQIFDSMIWQIVRKHCFNRDLYEDVYQELILELLNKSFNYILKNYQPESPFVPYFAIIAIRICQEKQRKMLQSELSQELREMDLVSDQTIGNKLLIDEEFQNLKKVIYLLKNDRIFIAFKYINRFQLERNEIKRAFPRISRWDLTSLVTSNTKSDPLVFFSKLLNRYNKTSNKVDSLRRLIDLYLQELCEQMTFLNPQVQYKKKDIIELFAHFHERNVANLVLKTFLLVSVA